MKVEPRAIDRFLKAPDAAARAILVYGPDAGLVRERAKTLIAGQLDDPDDPFRLVELTAARIKDDPAILRDEAAAMSLTGGRRVVRIRDGGDELAGVLGDFLEDCPGDALIVIEAGDLPARSKLRAVTEKSAQAAAVPCYRDDERSLPDVIRTTLSQDGFTISRDALGYLTQRLGGDRLVTRGELEKLKLYKGLGNASEEITLADALQSTGDSAHLTLEDLAFATAEGDLPRVERILQKAFAEGNNPIQVLRALSGHFLRLETVLAAAAEGTPADKAVGKLRPPVFWKVRDRFLRQTRTWSAEGVGRALSRLLEAELACKRTGAPASVLTSRALLEIAARSPMRRSAGTARG